MPTYNVARPAPYKPKLVRPGQKGVTRPIYLTRPGQGGVRKPTYQQLLRPGQRGKRKPVWGQVPGSLKPPKFATPKPKKPKAAPRPKAKPLAAPTGSQAQAQPLPFDATYERGVAGIQRAYTMGAGNTLQQQNQLSVEYGFENPADPYSRARMLENEYRKAQSGTTNRMAASGQLYSGATQTELDEGQFRYQRQYHDLRSDYNQRMNEVRQKGAELAATRDEDLADALAERIARAVDKRPEDPGPAAPAAKPKAKPKTKPKARTRPRPKAKTRTVLYRKGRKGKSLPVYRELKRPGQKGKRKPVWGKVVKKGKK